ncbi:hypothetical protein SDC9_176498 [bioreactor metagenome]|uniref:Uncharacterized protein n=1 Tax=bioreactor metagenome TaxID=1076179 RepID=A0A645GS03_9ZZZZ
MRLRLINQSCVQIGVDRHLLTGHGVQRKAGRNFGDTLRTFGHHDKVNDHQNDEHHKTDDKVTADHHLTERLNHLTGSACAHMPMQ